MSEEELLKLSPGELTDLGICPTCFNKKHNGALFGDDTNLKTYEDEDIECLFVNNPREKGHMMIASKEHFHDMMEASDEINTKMIKFAKAYMKIIKEVYGCERVYLCTMCDGPMNHYHIQLIPRYSYEKRGSSNFVKARQDYIFDKEKFEEVKDRINDYAINVYK